MNLNLQRDETMLAQTSEHEHKQANAKLNHVSIIQSQRVVSPTPVRTEAAAPLRPRPTPASACRTSSDKTVNWVRTTHNM